jgi:hypothetical protein
VNTVTPILIALLGAGILSFLKDFVKWMVTRHRASQPDQVESRRIHESVRQADESVIVVARARGELERDNERLRAEIAETAKRHAQERAEWFAERLQSALAEVRSFKERRGMTGPA